MMLYDIEVNDLATAEKRINAHLSVLETAQSNFTRRTPAASLVPVKLLDDIITRSQIPLASPKSKQRCYRCQKCSY
ncbi:MAG: hypothetical protein DRR19_27050 [Candidatus Parabeggiatoa sp. nov. 1]|nr:MAG: hypothetical protein DRR19_27050 [Gammaproteobacteria bacterium]